MKINFEINSFKKILLNITLIIFIPTCVYFGIRAFTKNEYDNRELGTLSKEERNKQNQYNKERKKYDFYIGIPLGIACLIVGTALSSPIVPGIIGGGIVLLATNYDTWYNLDLMVKFLSSLFIILLAIFLLHFKLNDPDKDKEKRC